MRTPTFYVLLTLASFAVVGLAEMEDLSDEDRAELEALKQKHPAFEKGAPENLSKLGELAFPVPAQFKTGDCKANGVFHKANGKKVYGATGSALEVTFTRNSIAHVDRCRGLYLSPRKQGFAPLISFFRDSLQGNEHGPGFGFWFLEPPVVGKRYLREKEATAFQRRGDEPPKPAFIVAFSPESTGVPTALPLCKRCEIVFESVVPVLKVRFFIEIETLDMGFMLDQAKMMEQLVKSGALQTGKMPADLKKPPVPPKPKLAGRFHGTLKADLSKEYFSSK